MVTRYFKHILPAALAAAAVCACAPEERAFPDAVPQGNTTISSLKAVFNPSHNVPAGTSLSVWKPAKGGQKFSMISENGGEPATFAFPDGSEQKQLAYALYPDIEIDSLYRGSFYLKIKSEQKAVEGGFDESLFISAGHIVKGDVTLTPVVGSIGFTINQPDIHYVTLACKDNAIAGAVKIAMGENVEVSKLSGATGRVEVSGDMAIGKSYSAVVMTDDYKFLDVTLKNQFGISVWEDRLEVGEHLAAGGSFDLGLIGDPNVSTLTASFTSDEFDGYRVKRVVGYADGSAKKIFGSDADDILQSGQSVSVKFYGVKSVDYSSTKIWYVFTLEKDGQRINLPIMEDGFLVPERSNLSLDLGNLTSARNAAPWYCSIDDGRIMSGAGFAYGDANTYLIQCKDSTYCDNLDPDPAIPQSVTIDYRLRGELFGSPAPEGVTFRWLSAYDGIYTLDKSIGSHTINYELSVDPANYTITVTNKGAFGGSPILLMEKDGQILWAWTFWNIAADGTRLKAVEFGDTGVKLANMDIGHCSDQVDSLTAHFKQIRYFTNYYQWGRPMPTFSGSGAGVFFALGDPRNAANAKVPVYDQGPVTTAEALRHPGYLIQNPFVLNEASENLEDWNSDGIINNTDLWGGGKDKEAVYGKSIYDPCPKGWRVPDANTFLKAFPTPSATGYSIAQFPQIDTIGYRAVNVYGVWFPVSGHFQMNISMEGYVSQAGYAHNNSTCSGNSFFWTNTHQDGTKFYAFRPDIYYTKQEELTENPGRIIKVDQKEAGCALPVRCQYDENDR